MCITPNSNTTNDLTQGSLLKKENSRTLAVKNGRYVSLDKAKWQREENKGKVFYIENSSSAILGGILLFVLDDETSDEYTLYIADATLGWFLNEEKTHLELTLFFAPPRKAPVKNIYATEPEVVNPLYDRAYIVLDAVLLDNWQIVQKLVKKTKVNRFHAENVPHVGGMHIFTVDVCRNSDMNQMHTVTVEEIYTALQQTEDVCKLVGLLYDSKPEEEIEEFIKKQKMQFPLWVVFFDATIIDWVAMDKKENG